MTIDKYEKCKFKWNIKNKVIKIKYLPTNQSSALNILWGIDTPYKKLLAEWIALLDHRTVPKRP